MPPTIPERSRQVRHFNPADAPAIEKILAQSPEAATWSAKSLEQLDTNNQQAWLIESENKTLGFLVARILPPDEAEILNLAVAAKQRRTGAATKLLHTALLELAEKKIRRVHLEVRESNAAAISFYERHNFARSGRRPNYYREPIEAAVLLVRELTA
jgi:ribosomal-protein-alanine acetyltransferase